MVSNQVRFFVEDQCDVDDQSFEVSKQNLYEHFQKYCRDHHYPVLCAEQFFRCLKDGFSSIAQVIRTTERSSVNLKKSKKSTLIIKSKVQRTRQRFLRGIRMK